MLNNRCENPINKRQKLEKNKTMNCHRCSSVDEKNNNSFFSKELEKEFFDIKHLVKNSVEKINILFNNEEFKQKTSKKIFQNNINKININKFYLNNHDTSFELSLKEDEKNNLFHKNNDKTFRKSALINNSFFGDEEVYNYNSNDLYQELKDLSTVKSKNQKKINKFFNVKKNNNIDTDNKSLLNLESNKLYRNKESNNKLKKLNITNTTTYTMKPPDKKQKDSYISNYMKTAKHQEYINNKNKKKDVMKYTQKNNNQAKKIERNSNNLKQRFTNNTSLCYAKNKIEKVNKDDKNIKIKGKNNSLKKDRSFIKKNHSNSMDIDLNLDSNNENNSYYKILNADKTALKKTLYKGIKSEMILENIFGGFKSSSKKCFYGIKNKKYSQDKSNPNFNLPSLNKDNTSKFINVKKKSDKITTQNLLQTIMILNQYLIKNNLIVDYSNPDNKKILDELYTFLSKNIKIVEQGSKEYDYVNNETKTQRIIKKENSLIKNINSEKK